MVSIKPNEADKTSLGCESGGEYVTLREEIIRQFVVCNRGNCQNKS